MPVSSCSTPSELQEGPLADLQLRGSAEEFSCRGLASILAEAGEDGQQVRAKRERLHHHVGPLHRPQHLRAAGAWRQFIVGIARLFMN